MPTVKCNRKNCSFNKKGYCKIESIVVDEKEYIIGGYGYVVSQCITFKLKK